MVERKRRNWSLCWILSTPALSCFKMPSTLFSVASVVGSKSNSINGRLSARSQRQADGTATAAPVFSNRYDQLSGFPASESVDPPVLTEREVARKAVEASARYFLNSVFGGYRCSISLNLWIGELTILFHHLSGSR